MCKACTEFSSATPYHARHTQGVRGVLLGRRNIHTLVYCEKGRSPQPAQGTRGVLFRPALLGLLYARHARSSSESACTPSVAPRRTSSVHHPRLYILHPLSPSILRHFSQNIVSALHMSEEQQQTMNEYSYQAGTLLNTIPFMPHNQPTMPPDSSVSSTYQVSLVSGTHSQ